MDRLRVLYFLEDVLQRGLIPALVERITREVSIPGEALSHDIRSARGGSSIVVEEFGRFLRDLRRLEPLEADIIIAAVDGDCRGYSERAEQLTRKVKATDPFRDMIVYAIPDPHIERWYLLDQEALKKGVGLKKGIEVPGYKCKKDKDYYKNILRAALREQGVTSALGGSEFGPEIARNISDLYASGKQDPSFERFVDDVRAAFRRAMSASASRQSASAVAGETAPE